MSLSEMLFIGLLGLAIFGPRKLATLGEGWPDTRPTEENK
jgi:Sec-independent protein translocase protein TatA